MPREDDIETVIPGDGTSPSPPAASPSASVSGVEATAPGRVEYTMPGHDEGPALEPRSKTPEAGDLIGTFVVEELLGRGAMGVVMLARDTDLDRRVAIKLLAADETDPTASARLLREAQSAGSLAHPNVVAVYQVGTHKGQVYVVMEFVNGGTLHEWIREEPRSWEEIVDVYLQAGEGLAAAHRLGLVHRDFKPDNVLIGSDGRVRVSDFGLVGRSGETQDVVSTLRSFDGVGGRLTQTGAIMGTPAYMPPEQLVGDSVDARSDQFSYCVAFFEALWGHRPYEGDTLALIFAAIESGTLQTPPADEVPASVREALLKGLQGFPEDRHDDVESLLVALRSHRRPPRRRGLIAGSAVALLGLGAAASAVVTPSSETTAPFECVDAAEQYGEAWSTERRAAVETAFASKTTGREMFVVLDTELQARRAEWIAGHDAACQARQRDEQTDTTYALRVACLEARQAEADLFSELLTTGDERLLDGAVSSSTTLVPMAACEDIEALQAAPRATPEQAKALLRLRRELTRARILLLAGRHGEVLELMTNQIEGLRKVDFAADLAVGLEIMARAQMQLAQYEDAEANLREALTLAAESRDHGTEARATGTLIFIVGQRQKRYDEALGMLPAGRAAAARSPDPRALSYLEAAIGSLFVSQKRYDEAEQSINRVIETLEALERPPPDELANAYASRGDLKAATGDPQGATQDQVRAVKIVGDGLGERHPFYGAFAMRLGMTYASNERYDDAVAAYAESLTAWEATYGKDHSSCALAMLYTGIAQRQAGRFEDAAASFTDGIGRNERAPSKDPAGLISLVDNLAYAKLQLGEWDAAWNGYVRVRKLAIAAGGEDDVRVAGYERALASVLQPQGKYDESLQHLERNRSQLVSKHGPKHPDVAQASALIGDTYFMLGDCVTAQRHYGSALRIRSDLELPPDEALAQLLVGSGQCDLVAGDIDAARESIEHAVVLANESTDQALLARLDFATARLRWRAGKQDSARRLVAVAVDRLANAGPASRHRATPMQAWLDEHAP